MCTQEETRIKQKIRIGKEQKEASAQHKFRDKRKKALSDMLVNHPEAAKRLKIKPGKL